MSDKNIVVIGGASGIGKQIALDFAVEGNNVAVADINEELMKQMIKDNRQEKNILPFVLDASSWRSMEHFTQQLGDKIGKVHTLVYSAGITKRLKFSEIDWHTWKKTMAVNLHGLFYSIKAIGPLIKNGGSIVIIGSGSAITGSGGGIHYSSSKGGAFGLMRSIVKEFGKSGINVNVVAPRVIESDMLDTLYPAAESKQQLKMEIPIGRLGTPTDISSLVKFLCREDAHYIHGQILLLDGGRTYS